MEYDSYYSRLTESELANQGVVLGALRQLRGNRRKHIAYVGMELTSGRTYWETLLAHGVKNRRELEQKLGPDAVWKLIMEPCVKKGTALADRLGSEHDLLFIAPSVFNANIWHWSQNAYIVFCYNVIAEFAGRHVVQDGWEYSLGGVREMFFTMLFTWRYIRWYNKDQAARIFGIQDLFNGLNHQETQALFEDLWRLRLYNESGQEIGIDKALALCVDAICQIQEWGFTCDELIGLAWSLKQLPMLSPFGGDGPTPWDTDLFLEARKRLHKIVADKSTGAQS